MTFPVSVTAAIQIEGVELVLSNSKENQITYLLKYKHRNLFRCLDLESLDCFCERLISFTGIYKYTYSNNGSFGYSLTLEAIEGLKAFEAGNYKFEPFQLRK